MKTKPTNQYKIKILQKVAEKILTENGFRLKSADWKNQIYENRELASTLVVTTCEQRVSIMNQCLGSIPFFCPLIKSLLRDGRFVFNKDCPLVLHGNLSLTIDALWESVSHYLSHEETAEIFQYNRAAKMPSVKIRREEDAKERELIPRAIPIPAEEFI
jgi:hypothetical protein